MFFAAAGGFRIFGAPHLAVMVLVVLSAVLLSVLTRRHPTAGRVACIAFAIVLVGNDVAYMIHGAFVTDLPGFLRGRLPLHVCDIAVYLLLITFLTGNRRVYELAWFWATAGTVNAIVTPDLQKAFPDYYFFHYFIAHGGVVIGALAATFGLHMRPAKGSVLRAFAISNLCLVPIALFNCLADANYMFLCAPPETLSPFIFLPWPWYLLVLEGVGLLLLYAVYLPFPLADRLRGRE